MSEAFIISAVRTPVGKGRPSGALAPLVPVDLTALLMQEALRRADVDSSQIEDAIWGCVTPLGDQGANLARLSVLKAGFPPTVPAVTINRMCGSSQQAVNFAAQVILSGDMDLILAGGTEMMSHQPLGADWPESWPEGFPYEMVHQGISAELMAEKWKLGRDELDDFAYRSHVRAMHAIQHGHFESQILPIERPDGELVTTDEGVRIPPNREKISTLRPVFKPDGVVTAGNSSQLSDGVAALVLASSRSVERYDLKPLVRVVSRAVVGSDPTLMLDAPIPATRQVLQRAGLTLDDMDVI